MNEDELAQRGQKRLSQPLETEDEVHKRPKAMEQQQQPQQQAQLQQQQQQQPVDGLPSCLGNLCFIYFCLSHL